MLHSAVSERPMASTKLLQLRPEVVRSKDYVVAFGPHDSLDKPCPYDCIAIGSAAAIKLAKAGQPVVAVYLPAGETISDLVPPEMLIGVDSIAAANDLEGRNLVVLDDETFSKSYSHVKEAVDEPETEGKTSVGVKRLAGILHYKTVHVMSTLKAFLPKLHLVIQLWKPKQNRRLKELITCLRKNVENPFIGSIHVFFEKDSGLRISDILKDVPFELRKKVSEFYVNGRFTHTFIMDYLAFMGGDSNDIVGYANADIFFDETIRELWNIDLRDRCISLLRHDYSSDGTSKMYGPRDDSQDAWFFSCDSLREHRDNGESWTSMDFEVGRAGCHNCFAGELVRRRWIMGNPALSIKAYHLHESPERTYNETDLVTRGVYATVAPCGIMESALLRQNAFPKRTAVKIMDTLVPTVEPWLGSDSAPYERGLKSIMTGLDPTITNKERSYHIITTNNVCVTPEGLISSSDGIGFGFDVDASELLWAQTTFSSVTPTTPVNATVFFPSDESPHSFGQQLWDAARAATIWSLSEGAKCSLQISGPEPLPAMKTYLKFLGVEYVEGALSVKGEARGLLPDAANRRLLEPIVKKLRSAFCETLLGDIEIKPGQWTVVDCNIAGIDAHKLDANSWLGKYMRAFRESEVVVINHPAAIPNLWMMHEGALVLDIKPSLHAARMATACGLRYMPLIFDSETYSGDEIARILLKAAGGFKASVESTGPKIYVPAVRSDGFHKHVGDGFRELVELWHEGGLCTRIFHNGVFCWYGSIGDTLLYDRRGDEWLQTDVPEEEKAYKKLLVLEDFMNWARRPRLLEAMTPSSGRRSKNIVFYGHIETARHFRARSSKATGTDWSTACEDFAMPVGSKYEYTQTEYLNRIKDSYYGLCLPGHGPKTNREVEYMALGVIPIFVGGAKPSYGLKKGKHYFEATTPEEVAATSKQAQTSSMASMDLNVMSKNCRSFYEDNWSPLSAWKLLQSKLL